MRAVIVENAYHLTGCEDPGIALVFHQVIKCDAFITDFLRACSDPHALAQFNGSFIGYVHVRDDQAVIQKRPAIKKTKVLQILQTCMLYISQKAGMVDVPLGVKVPITYANRDIEFEF